MTEESSEIISEDLQLTETDELGSVEEIDTDEIDTEEIVDNEDYIDKKNGVIKKENGTIHYKRFA